MVDLKRRESMSKLYWAKVRSNGIVPTKKNEDGGHDLYANFAKQELVIHPHEIKMIPTGVASSFDSPHVGLFKERGSTGIIGLAVRAGVMDSGFRNEWNVLLQNTTNKTIIISKITEGYEENGVVYYPYTKAIAQVCFVKLSDQEEEIIEYDKLLKIESERGLSMLGDSGK